MISTRSHFGRFALSLASALLVLGLVPAAHAQYSIPDCMVAGLNTITNESPDYYAGRDESYKRISSEWSADVAGLTPEQLKGYTAYVCANLKIVDLGKDDEETWHYEVDYPTVDQWYADGGGKRTTTTATGSTGGTSTTTSSSASTGSSTTTSSGTGGQNLTTQSETPPEDVLYANDFSTEPTDLVIQDKKKQPFEGQFVTEDGDSFLRVTSDQPQMVSLPSGADWSDYTVEARVRVTDADVALLARVADDQCSAYGVAFKVSNHTAQFYRSNAQCLNRPLKTTSGVSVNAGEWTDVRFTAGGDRFSAQVNGKTVLDAEDSGGSLVSGFPGIRLVPIGGKTGTLEIASIRVIQYHTLPEQLNDYAAAPGIAVAELQQLGLIPQGGTVLFTEPTAYISGDDFSYQPLAESSPRTNIVMAANITFKSGSTDYEDCGLNARIITDADGYAKQETEVVFDNSGRLLVYEYADPTTTDYDEYKGEGSPFPIGQSYHLLFTMIDSQLVVYVNGHRELEVNDLTPRAGSYGVTMYSASKVSKCTGTNVWVYAVK